MGWKWMNPHAVFVERIIPTILIILYTVFFKEIKQNVLFKIKEACMQ